MEPRELPSADVDVHRRRLEKSALALIALGRVLAQERSLALGIDGFLELLDQVSSAAPQHFTQVWSDPVAYFWVRRAVHFLASCRGQPLGTVELAYCAEVGARSPTEALELHLEEFKRFALAIAFISGDEIVFAEPYAATLPLAIPGTDVIVTGGERAMIAGARGASLELIDPRRTIGVENGMREGVRVERCPVVSVGDHQVFLNPARFRLPGIGFPVGWTSASLDLQSRHRPAVEGGLDAIRRLQPVTFAHMEQALHTIALRANDGAAFNISASELPGSFVCTVPSDAYALAGTFIHEFHHNTLFAIEEAGPFLEPGERDEVEGENHYSPWVDTLRPLHGILHAVYVFLPVFRFWRSVLEERPMDEGRLAHAREQVARIPVQLRIGVNQLRRYARFTQAGAALFAEMSKRVAEAEEVARALGATLDSAVIGISPSGTLRPVRLNGQALTVAQAMLDHLTRTDVNGECGEERADLERQIG
jgi:HEXXH motif-containing protein